MAKVKKARISFVIDMTPLVDITFLLLTFFMFTAKFKSEAESEQKFFIMRPQASADTSKLPERNLATIKIAIDSATADTLYYYELTNEQDRAQVWQRIPAIAANPALMKKAQLNIADMTVLGQLILNTRLVNTKTRFAIEADRRIRYKWVSDVMDVMRKNRATVFNFVTEKRQ